MPNLSLRLFAAIAVLLCSACMDAADQAGNSRVTLTTKYDGVECRVDLLLPNAHWDLEDSTDRNDRRGSTDHRSVSIVFYLDSDSQGKSAQEVLYQHKLYCIDKPAIYSMVQVIDDSILFYEGDDTEHYLGLVVWVAVPDRHNTFVQLTLDYPLSSDGDEATQQRRREEYEAEALKILGSADFEFIKS